MANILTKKVRLLLDKSISKGVPPVAAGMVLGIKEKVITSWVTTGLSFDEKPPPPDSPKGLLENDGIWISNLQWWEHECECYYLSKSIILNEGKLVSELVSRMWAMTKNRKYADMMKFMFKNYAHVHKLTEQPAHIEVKSESKDIPKVEFYIPSNGRDG